MGLIYLYLYQDRTVPVPVAVRSKAWVCGRSPAEIVGSNLLPAFQAQVLIWTGDSGSNPERAHGDKFLDGQRPN